MILYLDANAIIYGIEGIPGLRRVALRWIEEAEVSPESVMVTSRLSMLECRVKPLREGDHAGVGRIDGFFQREKLVLADVSASVIEQATELRAAHGASALLTLSTSPRPSSKVQRSSSRGDAGLARCPGLKVEVLTPEP